MSVDQDGEPRGVPGQPAMEVDGRSCVALFPWHTLAGPDTQLYAGCSYRNLPTCLFAMPYLDASIMALVP